MVNKCLVNRTFHCNRIFHRGKTADLLQANPLPETLMDRSDRDGVCVFNNLDARRKTGYAT